MTKYPELEAVEAINTLISEGVERKWLSEHSQEYSCVVLDRAVDISIETHKLKISSVQQRGI